MARDYKHRAARKGGRKPVAIWVWLLIGFLAGAASVGFLCFRFCPAPESGEWIGARPPPERRPVSGEAEKREPARRVPPPDFDFYNLLPDQEVVVPEEELARPAPRPQPPRPRESTPPEQKPAQAGSGRKYLVQVSSMRSPREADALKARLAFLGLHARVSRASIKGVTWYRVRLGPFDSAAQVRKVRKRLSANGYDSLVVALK